MGEYRQKVPGGYNLIVRQVLRGFGDPIEVGKVYQEVRGPHDHVGDEARMLVVDIDYSDKYPEITFVYIDGIGDHSPGDRLSCMMSGPHDPSIKIEPWRRTWRLAKDQRHQ